MFKFVRRVLKVGNSKMITVPTDLTIGKYYTFNIEGEANDKRNRKE